MWGSEGWKISAHASGLMIRVLGGMRFILRDLNFPERGYTSFLTNKKRRMGK